MTSRKVVCLLCDDCQLPVATVAAGYVVIRTRHHSERHQMRQSLEHLVRQLLSEAAITPDELERLAAEYRQR